MPQAVGPRSSTCYRTPCMDEGTNCWWRLTVG